MSTFIILYLIIGIIVGALVLSSDEYLSYAQDSEKIIRSDPALAKLCFWVIFYGAVILSSMLFFPFLVVYKILGSKKIKMNNKIEPDLTEAQKIVLRRLYANDDKYYSDWELGSKNSILNPMVKMGYLIRNGTMGYYRFRITPSGKWRALENRLAVDGYYINEKS